ncbi:cupin [Spirosoma agri]|uniref:Cupin n=1 Tax=Spirosoma agri TaxID=1987381 RepID=A0A6M0ISD4_9BACT|nr:cupin [Spirosoma agri]NEU70485.1 cupin [Spirosoma agri]
MRFFLLFCVGVWTFLPAFSQAVPSNVYAYSPSPGKQAGYQEQTLLEGTTRDFSHFIVQAITIGTDQPAQSTQQFDEEVVLLIRAGELTLTLGNKHKTLGPGSLVLIMPGDDYRVDNQATQPLTYYQMRYTSNEMPDLDLYRLLGGSFWVDWQDIASNTDSKGSNRRLVPYPTVMSNRIAMQLTTVNPGLGKEPPQTHRSAELLLVLDHPVEAHLGGTMKKAQAGDLIFIESEIARAIYPGSAQGCTYLSFQF